MPIGWMIAPWLAGCGFESVDDACRDNVRGDQHGSPEAAEVIGRISCYRTYVGLDRGDIDKRITDAVASHASYLTTNEVLSTTGDWWAEDPAGSGFTGVDSFARLYDAEYLTEGIGSAFIWEVLLPVLDGTRAQTIDEVMVSPLARDALLAPAWEGSGYDEGTDPLYGDFAYMNIVLYYPSGARSTRPVIYPQDGQLDVPTSWSVDDPDDPAMAELPRVAGFPITFTMGSSSVGGTTNPLNVSVSSSTITGPGGAVEHLVLLPGLYTVGVNWSTAILVPIEPLAPDTTYTVEAELSWIDVQGKREELSFTTGSE